MKKTIILYGILLAVLTGILKFIEYRFLVRELSVEFYVGLVAFFFTSFGIWIGLKFTRQKNPRIALPKSSIQDSPIINLDEVLAAYGISKREHEVLTLMAKGYSNQEIADELFLSLNTVKSHLSNLFQKLAVKRRTQAVQKSLEIGLISQQAISS